MMLGGLTEAVLMVALALGYIVCYLANREEKNLKALGYLIGVFIIAFSAAVILGNALLSARIGCAMGKMRKMGLEQHKIMMQQQ